MLRKIIQFDLGKRRAKFRVLDILWRLNEKNYVPTQMHLSIFKCVGSFEYIINTKAEVC